jgi:lipopolysaccharide cholinephosphotransferase
VSLGSPYPTFKEIYSKEWFKDTTTMQFDGLEVQLPAGYDSLLRQIYGDYMQMPPEDKRESDHHHYILDLKRKLS